jgi:hypothetical protein
VKPRGSPALALTSPGFQRAIDASVVRALLVPALIGRLGERTWWAPKPLRRLQARVGLREGGLAEAPA